jgi:hypothetical protein
MHSQHEMKWCDYQLLISVDEQQAFIQSTAVPFVSTLHVHLSDNEPLLHFTLNKSIVEIIIGVMFFHPDDIEGVTEPQALSIFKIVDGDKNNE